MQPSLELRFFEVIGKNYNAWQRHLSRQVNYKKDILDSLNRREKLSSAFLICLLNLDLVFLYFKRLRACPVFIVYRGRRGHDRMVV